ncbi:hypothetical protein PAMA_008139 [Pampus argenteus]
MDTVDTRRFRTQVDAIQVLVRRKTAEESSNLTSSDNCCPDLYSTNYPSMGTCVIINNKEFTCGMSPRTGTDVDADAASKIFTELGYNVRMYNDQNAWQMKSLMSSVSKEDHSDCASFVCVLLSHGEEGAIYGTDGPVEYEELTKGFKGNRCKSLLGKPKLFFIQACRGSHTDPGASVMADSAVQKSTERIPVEADFLYFYSTAPGYFSWRDAERGSWFIQALCDILRCYSKKLELMHILTRVSRKVALNFQCDQNKQVSCVVSMLTADFYFYKNK